MATFPLLHVFDNAASPPKPGLFSIGDGREIPARWQPAPSEYEAEAFPTPFARAEATRLLLAHVDEAKDAVLVREFQWLVLGIASGALSLEPQDLSNPEYDNFGRALLRVDPDARYFCRILGRDSAGAELSFGATYRTSLVWGHARRQKLEWDQLAQAVAPLHHEALQVLADWRESLRIGGRWDKEQVAWQRGIDFVIGSTVPSAGLSTLHNDTQLIGPVNVELPTGVATELPRQELLYLPRYRPGFARAFHALCRVRPGAGKGGIEFRSQPGDLLGQIRVPAVGANIDSLALGMGLLDLPPSNSTVPSVPEGAKRWIDGPDGLLKYLEPVKLKLAQMGRATAPDALVVQQLALYPDPIRLLAKTRIGALEGGAYTTRADSLLSSRGVTLPDVASAEAAGGATASLEINGKTLCLVLLDRLGDVEVLDLRAIGAVLWELFVGDATVLTSQSGNIVQAGDVIRPMMVHSSESPFEAASWVYESVAAVGGTLANRLGTLQRFVASYSVASGRTSPIDFVLDRSARSYARWASGLPDVAPIGRLGMSAGVYRLPIGVDVSLTRDSLHTS